MATKKGLRSIVGEIRARWRRRTLIRGAALTAVSALVLAFLLLIALANLQLTPAIFGSAVALAALLLIGIAWTFIANPLRHQPTDEQIALFVEEKLPELEDRFNSAVEVEGSDIPAAKSALIARLLDDALSRAGSIRPDTILDRRREQLLAGGAGALFLAVLFFGWSIRDRIDFPNGRVELTSLSLSRPAMAVTPGDAEIERGASQEIIARLRDDVDEAVVLVWREGEGEWRREPMIRGAVGEPAFILEIENIQEPVQYFVEQQDLRSEPFTLSLYEFPDVADIAARVNFPSYTGLPSRTEEGTGDVSALIGSRATISINTIGTTEKAEAVFSDGATFNFEKKADNEFSVVLPVTRTDYYTIKLTDARGKNNRFPEEYRIEALEDLQPTVAITDPKRDVRANSIEEVLVAAEARDDFGLKSVKLVYSVNANDEQAIDLAESLPKGSLEADGSHLFFLEDFSLQPGDVISYYVEVEDFLEREAPVATDMYFIEVVPFDQEFTQVNNMGGAGGGPEQSAIVVSQQQIIAATWKLIRERPGMSADEFDSAAKALVQAQANLKENILQRISSTAFSLELRANEEQQKLVEHLRASTVEMDKAIDELEKPELKIALKPERRALNELLRADALNREQQVTNQRGQGSGGGGSAQDRITELMDLELDISKDKYETQQQRSQSPQNDRAVDEALNKVRELARKQEELARQSNRERPEGEDKKQFVEKLKRDQDEIRQQTEQLRESLGRQSSDSQSRDLQRQMDRVAENMEKAERSLRQGDVDEAMTHQRRALDELEQLQDQLTLESADDAREKVRRLAEQFDDFRTQEKRLEEDIERTAQQVREDEARGQRGVDRRTANELSTKRERMIERLDDLRENAEGVEKSIRDDDPALAGAIRNMLQQMRREGLEKNMDDSREALRQGWIDYADRKEDMIMETIDALDDQRRAFDGTLPVSDEERLTRSMQDMRELREQIAKIEQESRIARGEEGDKTAPGRKDQRGQGERSRQGQDGRQGEQGQQAQQGEQGEQGRQGRQGQQGEQGRQGRQGQQGEQARQGQQGQQGSGGQAGGDRSREARAAQARLEREVERARQTLDRLEQNLGPNGEGREQVEALRSFLSRADNTGVRLEGDAARDFFNDRAFTPLTQLEEGVVRRLDLAQLEKKLYGTQRSDVPLEYQELVDKYYESLAKENR